MKKIKNIMIALIIILILANAAEAVRVAVVVDLQNQTYTKCVTVSENANAYKVMQGAGLSISWADYGGMLGHGLCGIKEIGCPSFNCYCDMSRYWGFYVKQKTDSGWSYSQVGFDGGSSCSEHYCAEEGDMIGLAYGAYGTYPPEYEYNEICSEKKAKQEDKYAVSFAPQNPATGDIVAVKVFDNETREGIKKIDVTVYYKDARVFIGETDPNGTLSFIVNKTGQYEIKLNVLGYEDPQKTILINVSQKTTATTTTTSTTQETTTTTSSTTTTSTTSSSTTTTSTTAAATIEPTIITTTTSTTQPEKISAVGMVTGSQPEYGIIGVLVILAAGLFIGFKTLKRKK